ncbi:MAG: TrbI/VirB10 family protein, partial [Gemmatimonadaceae bacterium]
TAPPTAAGTYLDQPLRRPVQPTSLPSSGIPSAQSAPTPSGADPAAAGLAAPVIAAPDHAVYPGAYSPMPGGVQAPVAPPAPTAAELRAAAYQRALEASPIENAPVSTVTAQGGSTRAVFTNGPSVGTEPSSVPAVATRGEQFLQSAGAAAAQNTTRALTVQAAPGPYAVQAGTVIPAVLMTEINSDLPGECLAQITRDVYDSRSQQILLIPRGAKLLCKYDDQLATGQSRLLVAWTRILLPDGRSISLPGLPATDQTGARGVSDQVDRHVARAYGTAGLLSLLTAGVQLAQPRNSGSVFAAPSTGEVMAGALGQQLNGVSVEMLRRDLTNHQTIRIRQGVEFNVFLNSDLTFPGPYAPESDPRTVVGGAIAQRSAPR